MNCLQAESDRQTAKGDSSVLSLLQVSNSNEGIMTRDHTRYFRIAVTLLVFLSFVASAENTPGVPAQSRPDPGPGTDPEVSLANRSGLSAYDSWIESARKGNATAQYNLGLIFEQGTGVRKNLKTAVTWYQKAAKQGHVASEYNLATMLHFGQGIAKNEYAAAKWYERAAKQGHIAAQSSLAYLYLQHSDRKFRNTKKAAYWYTKAAKLGYPEAQFNLGLLYASGRGVLLDYKLAYAWFDLANLNHYKNALKSKLSAASRLNKAQLSEARQIAKTMQQLYFRKYP